MIALRIPPYSALRSPHVESFRRTAHFLMRYQRAPGPLQNLTFTCKSGGSRHFHSGPKSKRALDSHPAVGRIRSVLSDHSFTSGTCKIPVEQCDLYYRVTPASPYVTCHCLNLANATDAELAELAEACDTAPFGRGNETVVDETYRKALKLDLSRFGMSFDLAGTRILNKISQDLLKSGAHHRFIRAEPYKLNIYDKGAFFKPHQDTPRAENMFGSLVIIFPTAHEGGAFILREKGSEWSFDAQMLAKSTPSKPEIAYVAFYSDTEHEVLPVTSGARVTLTYNLYFEDTANFSAPTTKHLALKEAMQELVADPELSSQGVKKLCFGLAHQYPIQNPTSEAQDYGYSVFELKRYLKGSDELIYSVCQELGLKPNLKILYDSDRTEGLYLADEPACGTDWEVDRADEASELMKGTEVVQEPYDEDREDDDDMEDDDKSESPLFWVTPRSNTYQVDMPYIAYGNEATLGHMYGEVCLVVEV